jgi:hypothetical protein
VTRHLYDRYGLKWWWAHRDFLRPMFERLAARLAARQAAERDDYLALAAKLAAQQDGDDTTKHGGRAATAPPRQHHHQPMHGAKPAAPPPSGPPVMLERSDPMSRAVEASRRRHAVIQSSRVVITP